MKQQKDIISILIKIAFAVIFFFIWGILIFYPNKLSPQFIIPNGCIFLVILSGIIVSMKWLPLKNRNKIWNEKVCLAAASVCLLGLELFISWNIIFRTSWDPGAVWYGSHYVALNDINGINTMSEYFSIYPNNLLLVFLYSSLLKLNLLAGEIISNGILLLVIFQCVILTLTGIMVFWCAKHYVSTKAAWCVYFLYAVMAGLSGWIVIPYSDGTGIIFPVCLLALYLKIKETNNTGKQYILLFIMMGMGVIGYQIKPTSVIILIAAAAVEFVNWMQVCIREKRFVLSVKIACSIFISLAAFILTLQGSSLLVDSMHFNVDPERELGWQHHLMLGANTKTSGGFSEEDLAYSSGFDDKKTKNAEELNVFKKRMQEMGVKGYWELSLRKAARSYLNGTFGWGGGSSFYTEIYPERSNPFCSLLRSWYYDNEENTLYRYHAFIRQIIWFFILALIPFVTITKRKYSAAEKVLMVSLIGLVLYLQLFESHSRYLFVFIPVFCILAIQGYETLAEIVRGKFKSHEYTNAG